MNLSKEERAQINALAIKGQLDAARCVERLLMDGETVFTVLIVATGVRIEIAPPRPSSPLWREAGTCRITASDLTFLNTRYGCEIRWALTRAEAELMRIQDAARRVH